MKYSAKQYAVALQSVLQATAVLEQDRVIDNFISEVRRNRDDRHLSKIVEEISQLVVKDGGGRNVVVEVAREQDKTLLTTIGKAFTGADRVEYKINPDLVAGLRVTFNGEKEFDNSLAYKIKTLFKK
ncbi:MAG: F0F1 ATP synthase subunit delta [bacterium]